MDSNNNDEQIFKIDDFQKHDDDKEIINEVIMEDFFETTLNDYEEFEEHSWHKGAGYKIPSYPSIENKLEGLESGLYIFAGESNGGKTSIMSNLLKDISCCKENNLFGLYYSLDDSKNEVIPRIIAMDQEIPIAVASKPQRYKDMAEQYDNDNAQIYNNYLEKRQKGLQQLKAQSNQFKIEDANKIKNSTDLKNHMMKVQTFVKSKNPNANIIVAIDSINDIQLDPAIYGRNLSDITRDSEIAKFVKDLSVELDIVIFASSHLRKLNGNRRPTVDDLKNANTLLYEASVVWLVYNDVSKNKTGAKIYWNDINADNNLGAIIELDWAKNKKSSYKGRTFCMFKPYYSLTKECDEQDAKRYETLIYQS